MLKCISPLNVLVSQAKSIPFGWRKSPDNIRHDFLPLATRELRAELQILPHRPQPKQPPVNWTLQVLFISWTAKPGNAQEGDEIICLVCEQHRSAGLLILHYVMLERESVWILLTQCAGVWSQGDACLLYVIPAQGGARTPVNSANGYRMSTGCLWFSI